MTNPEGTKHSDYSLIIQGAICRPCRYRRIQEEDHKHFARSTSEPPRGLGHSGWTMDLRQTAMWLGRIELAMYYISNLGREPFVRVRGPTRGMRRKQVVYLTHANSQQPVGIYDRTRRIPHCVSESLGLQEQTLTEYDKVDTYNLRRYKAPLPYHSVD